MTTRVNQSRRRRGLPDLEPVEVLDHGYVELIDYMGEDSSVVEAARVSYNKRPESYTDDANSRLLQYLIDHNHGTPFEMVTFKFRVRAPAMVWWHWVRHRMASYNFQSGRYTPLDDAPVYKPAVWRKQSKVNKQGSDGEVSEDIGKYLNSVYEAQIESCVKTYRALLDAGVAKEQARLVLPGFAVYYEAIVQMNARSLKNFIDLRLGDDAQMETREYAKAIRTLVRKTHPKIFP